MTVNFSTVLEQRKARDRITVLTLESVLSMSSERMMPGFCLVAKLSTKWLRSLE